MTKERNNQIKQSFTLVELLIVIAIIGILAAAVIFGVKKAAQNARDARRLEDIENIAKALHSYYLDTGSFPKESDGYSGGSWKGTIGVGNLIDNVIKQYMGRVPKDPIHDRPPGDTSSSNNYYYYYYDGNHACGGGNPNKAIIFVHRMETQSANGMAPCTSLGGEGGSNDPNRYLIILGDSSG